MKITFWRSNKPLDRRIAELVGLGAKAHGLEFETRWRHEYDGPMDDTDVGMAIAVRSSTKTIMNDHVVLGKKFIYVDKGYLRTGSNDPMVRTKFWRFAVNSTQPLAYFQKIPHPPNRFEAWGVDLKPVRLEVMERPTALFAGSSQKYCDFHRVGDATGYAKCVFSRLRKYGYKRLIYRPKPSWRDAVPIDGTEFSILKNNIAQEMLRSDVLVTHGSNAALDAVFNGVPAIVLGPSIAAPVASIDYRSRSDLYFPTEKDRLQWASDVAYCQWSLSELASGEAWETFLVQLEMV